jgi:hypothetical protein
MSPLPTLEGGQPYDRKSWENTLEEAKEDVKAGRMSKEDYDLFEQEAHIIMEHPRSLAGLEKIPHTTPGLMSREKMPEEIRDPSPVGYYHPEHEEEYLASLDAELDGHAPPPLDSHPIRSYRETDPRNDNPVSSLNWLRNNHPGVFLQGDGMKRGPVKEPKEPKETVSNKRKRQSVVPKPDQEMYEDEDFPVGLIEPATTKTKRKRDDEPYRPKGGSNSRASKKKKLSTGQAAVEAAEAE